MVVTRKKDEVPDEPFEEIFLEKLDQYELVEMKVICGKVVVQFSSWTHENEYVERYTFKKKFKTRFLKFMENQQKPLKSDDGKVFKYYNEDF
jgi:hypothetical protein